MPMIQATALIFCGTYVLLTLLADAAALAADPRLKHR
jgi:ABC-type dipeptide/oligopeptide/nickel transport system permease component